jgi:hypothetical protein
MLFLVNHLFIRFIRVIRGLIGLLGASEATRLRQGYAVLRW